MRHGKVAWRPPPSNVHRISPLPNDRVTLHNIISNFNKRLKSGRAILLSVQLKSTKKLRKIILGAFQRLRNADFCYFPPCNET